MGLQSLQENTISVSSPYHLLQINNSTCFTEDDIQRSLRSQQSNYHYHYLKSLKSQIICPVLWIFHEDSEYSFFSVWYNICHTFRLFFTKRIKWVLILILCKCKNKAQFWEFPVSSLKVLSNWEVTSWKILKFEFKN